MSNWDTYKALDNINLLSCDCCCLCSSDRSVCPTPCVNLMSPFVFYQIVHRLERGQHHSEDEDCAMMVKDGGQGG